MASKDVVAVVVYPACFLFVIVVFSSNLGAWRSMTHNYLFLSLQYKKIVHFACSNLNMHEILNVFL